VCKRSVDQTMALHRRVPRELGRHDHHPEVGLAWRPRVEMALVVDDEVRGKKAGAQRPLDARGSCRHGMGW
jgi:hypothetical protein